MQYLCACQESRSLGVSSFTAPFSETTIPKLHCDTNKSWLKAR